MEDGSEGRGRKTGQKETGKITGKRRRSEPGLCGGDREGDV